MKKLFTKENIIAILLYTVTFLFIYAFLVGKTKLFGSTTDFSTQHFLLPEYFRNLFYSSGNVFPDFSFNLSGGINIFYLSYYGLFSPVIIISYLFPYISMMNYVILSTSIIIILSSILFYFYLRKHQYGFLVSLLGGFLFIIATPLTFHAHRHIMFINYIIFLVLGMYGVDRVFEKKKITLLVVSIFLMILTSYYYSVAGIIALFLLGIYKYLKANKKIKFKVFTISILKFCIPFIIGVLLSMFLILPTLYVLLNGRVVDNSSISLVTLLTPNLSFKYLLYSPYSVGVGFISLLSSVYLLFKGKKEDKFLSIIILLIGGFPLFNYIFNGTLYIDSKSLIPFLPLVIISTSRFLYLLIKKKVDFKFLLKIINILIIFSFIQILISVFNLKEFDIIYLLDRFSYPIFVILEGIIIFIIVFCSKKDIIRKLFAYLFIFSTIVCISVNLGDKLMKIDSEKTKALNEDYKEIEKIIEKDDGYYRINNSFLDKNALNKIINSKHLQSSVYSSTFNKTYNSTFYDTFNNAIPYRNRTMIAFSNNILFNIFMAEKYIIADNNYELNYKLLSSHDKFNVYQNPYAFPLGYSNSSLLSKSDYDKLEYPNNAINLLKSVIVEDQKSNLAPYILEKEKANVKIVEFSNLAYVQEASNYNIKANNNARMKIEITNNYKNKVLFIRFKNNRVGSCNEEDLLININGVINKLTCKSWKYSNKNYVFDYAFLDTNILDIKFNPGKYELSDFEIYILNFDQIKNINRNIDPFNIKQINNDKIIGDINVTKDGYFVIQIPYDKGFEILVDGKKTKYQEVNQGFIGFKINAGEHQIIIEYKAPYKNLGIIISLVGLLSLIIYNYFQKKKKDK